MATTAPKGKALLFKAFLALLVIVPSIYLMLPQAVCDLETDEEGNPKIVTYIWLSESRKTATVLISKGEEGYDIFDDRCQKGTVIGQWQPLKELAREPKQVCPSQPICPIVVGYVTNCYTGATDKYICEGMGADVPCFRADELQMPFDE